MEIIVFCSVVAFSLLCLYLGFSRDKYLGVVFGLLGGAGLVVAGFGVGTELVYIGAGSVAVIVYGLQSDAANAAGHYGVGALFALSGMAIIIFSMLLFIFGDSQSEPGEWTERIDRWSRPGGGRPGSQRDKS